MWAWVAMLALGLLAVGMVHYAPTRTDRLLFNERRSNILAFLRKRPGASISDVCRANKLSWGSAQHHLYLLERAGLIQSREVDRRRVLFPGELQLPAQQALGVVSNKRAREISVAVLMTPGIRQKPLLQLLNMTRKVFRHHINLLVAAGLVTELQGPKIRIYRPTELLRASLPPEPGPDREKVAEPPAGVETPGRE